MKLWEWAKENAMGIVSWVFAAYFFYAFHLHVCFPPTEEITQTGFVYLIVFTLFLLAPFAKRFKLGSILEWEAKIKELKQEVKDTREESRQLFNVLNATINTISNTLTNNVNVYMPGYQERERAREDIQFYDSRVNTNTINELINEFRRGDDDLVMPLARVRIELEHLLREILGKRTASVDLRNKNRKFYSAGSLFRIFLKEYPDYKHLGSSFDYVLRLCNAAIHGQVLDKDQAFEALEMGAKIISVLKEINGNNA
ncbi:MAG: hypothetical protein AB2692_04115 [Candidatus Thiodiazotropha sp.]